MKNALLVVVTAGALSACADMGKTTTSVCGEDLNRPTRATITYRSKNKFEVSLDLKTDVRPFSEFKIRLDPKRGSEDAVIQTVGRSGELPNGDPTPFDWLDASGKASDFEDEIVVLCVPNVPLGTMYKFDVIVDGIGTITTIDPRVEVTN